MFSNYKHLMLVPTPEPNDDVSVDVSYNANGNNEKCHYCWCSWKGIYLKLVVFK